MSIPAIPRLDLARTRPVPRPSQPSKGSSRASYRSSSRTSAQSSISRHNTQSSLSARSTRSCPQMRNSTESFASLQNVYHLLMVKLPADIVDPEFPRQFKRFTQAYDAYTKQVSIHYSGVNPSHKVWTSSPLYKAGQTLMTEWADFIERTNTLEDNGLTPYTEKINGNFGFLHINISNIQKAITNVQFRTDKASTTLVTLSQDVKRLKSAITKLFLRPKSKRWANFNEAGQLDLVRTIHSQICYLFDSCLPQYSTNLGDLAKLRNGLTRAVSDIGALVEAAKIFDLQFPDMKEAILHVNDELNTMHERLKLPFVIQLSISVEEEDQNDPIFDLQIPEAHFESA